MQNTTEDQIKELGFVFVKSYPHRQFRTNRYKKGVLEVEFTYEGEKFLDCELTIVECECRSVSLDELKQITPILGEWE